jgi:mono/diheme cytochrome c family protein
MRHLIVNVFVYSLGALLLLGSAIFAWIRSEQIVVTRESETVGRVVAAAKTEAELRALGEASYDANCRHCHGADGRGWDQYPGIHGMDRLVASPDGRRYYVALHLFGVASPRWRAPMPPMGHIADVELAAVLQYVIDRFGEAEDSDIAITPDEIAEARAEPISAREVGRLRP